MHLLAIDGNSILNRAFYAIKLLSTKDGFYTNGIYGFLTMLRKIESEVQSDAVAIAFDLKKPTFRHKKYEAYKAKRKSMPTELAEQIPVLKKLLVSLGYTVVECEAYEADDILGTLSYSAQKDGNKCTIATGDRDALQLVSDFVNVLLLTTKSGRTDTTPFNNETILEKYGLSPKQLIDLKAIQGDASDNIPGVKGIGEKGAKQLISKYGSLNYIYENLESLEIRDSLKEKLKNSKDMAYLSYDLGTIVRNAPIDVNLDHYKKNKINMTETYNIMSKLELFSLMEKFGVKNPPMTNIKKEESLAEAKLRSICLKNIEEIQSMQIESSNIYLLYSYKNKIITAVAFTDGSGSLYFTEKLEIINHIFRSNYNIITHNVKQLYACLNKEIFIESRFNITFDSMLAAYLIEPSAKDYSVEKILEKYAPGLDTQLALSSADISENTKDILHNLVFYPDLCKILSEKINTNGQEDLLKNIELKLSKILYQMEQRGFAIDAEGIKKFRDELSRKIDKLTEDIYSLSGCVFNINSPKQLGEVLYQKLLIPTGKKNKLSYSTSAEVLERLRYDYPIVGLILEYRSLSKLKSTYCDAMLRLKDEADRIHTSFNQTETRTGRISSLEPNLQNIPVRTEIGRQLRRFFCAEPGNTLIDADYSQIELRVLAHISGDETMIEAFKNGEDIHKITASQVFDIPQNMVTPIMRTRAKAVNFGIVYGISAFSLAKSLNIDIKEAADYINNYKNNYKAVDDYMNKIVIKAKKTGFVTTLFNRRRYLPELKSSNFNLRSFGERVARNMPIQGTAADIIKIAMIKVSEHLERENFKSKLILQIHDELIIESPLNEVDQVKDILKLEMENAVKLRVPLTVDISVGKTWYETKN